MAAYNALVYAFLLAPIAVVLVFAFSDAPTFAFPPDGYSLRWFRYLAGRDEFITSMRISVEVASLAAAGAVALGLPASLVLVRHRVPGKALAEAVLMGPLLLPGIVLGIALLQYFIAIGLTQSFSRLVLGHLVLCLPYAIRSISASLYGLDPSLEEAALTLGATRVGAFRRVVLPLLRPGMAAGFLFAFITSFDNVVVSIYLIGADTVTLPIRILNWIEWQFDPSIAAISAIVLAVTLGLVLLAERLTSGGRQAGLDRRRVANVNP
jgi:putative spermidine/putrescine transport system permease protein